MQIIEITSEYNIKMSVVYDEKNKLWSNLSEPQSNDEGILLGQSLLNFLSANGSKVAQVF